VPSCRLYYQQLSEELLERQAVKVAKSFNLRNASARADFIVTNTNTRNTFIVTSSAEPTAIQLPPEYDKKPSEEVDAGKAASHLALQVEAIPRICLVIPLP
jgi:hypothetical protein